MKEIQQKTVAMKIVEERLQEGIEELLRRNYVDNNLPISTIATEIGVSYVTVFSWLKMCNVVHRKIEWEDV